MEYETVGADFGVSSTLTEWKKPYQCSSACLTIANFYSALKEH